MKAIKSFVGAGLMAAVVLVPSLASASDASAAREVTVYYEELNMGAGGAAALYSRLRSASRQVCAPFAGRELRSKAAYRACYDQALSNSVVQVKRSAVTALHASTTKGLKTS